MRAVVRSAWIRDAAGHTFVPSSAKRSPCGAGGLHVPGVRAAAGPVAAAEDEWHHLYLIARGSSNRIPCDDRSARGRANRKWVHDVVAQVQVRDRRCDPVEALVELWPDVPDSRVVLEVESP